MALVFAITIFVSAFLLFQVQPLIGKYILPWFGGTSGVWTTCMLFFQVLLLGGYLYAHLLQHFLRPRAQAIVHIALLVLAALTLPIIPADAWKPAPSDEPTLRILILLAVTVGAPYLMLASTAPLLQRWFSRTAPGASPYRLYALSNAGSLLALFSYPFLFERLFQLPVQAWTWSVGFIAFALLCTVCALRQMNATEPAAQEAEATAPAPAERVPGAGEILLWLALAGFGSIMLLAITNQLCQDVAVVPFLWLLPLSIYLLSFIITFESDRWYRRGVFGPLLLAGVAAGVFALARGIDLGLKWQIGLYTLTLFACCMSLHGELARSRPAPRYLTLFYVAVSAGGAIGGVFVAIVAPLVFDAFFELHVGLVGTCLLVLIAMARSVRPALRDAGAAARTMAFGGGALALAAIAMLGVTLGRIATRTDGQIVRMERNFYGVLKVVGGGRIDPETLDLTAAEVNPGYREFDVPFEQLELVHGRILHGMQLLYPELRDYPTTYYIPESGVGLALTEHPQRETPGRPFRVGAVGLGAGSLAVYGGAGVEMAFYEINPLVVDVAERHFSYLADARARGGEIALHMGDARLVMEEQLERGEPMRLDVLVVDAFSSDAIPVHLLTAECFEIYRRHLADGGVIVVHVSNRYLNLRPVVRAAADRMGLEARQIAVGSVEQASGNASDWILVTDNAGFLERIARAEWLREWDDQEKPILWTDRYSNLFDVLE